ncbi:MAG: BolA family protein [Polyangiaceae bacterium]
MSRQQAIEERLRAAFTPTHLTVENESHQHSVAPGSETHFAVVVVSDAFAGAGLVARHRKVNAALEPLFAEGLHALRIRAATPTEFAAAPVTAPAPKCLGGSKADA